MQQLFEYSEEVKQAVGQIAREQGVTPATIAIIGGKIKIGLSAVELATLAENKFVYKTSSRDITFILSMKYSAGTTLIIAVDLNIICS